MLLAEPVNRKHFDQSVITSSHGMAATIYTSPFLYNSLLSDLEIDILDVICYQFEQYGGLDWENLASGLAFNMDSPLRDKVRLNQGEIDRADRHCSSMHEKLHVLVNTFVLRCRMFDVNIDLIDHFIEVLSSERIFHTPYRILVETIIHRRMIAQ